jgi:hypothetical protein
MSTITGRTVTSTVTLSTTGSYASPLTVASDGAVETAGTAIYGPNTQAWSVANAGTIEGTGTAGEGIYLKAGGSISNGGTALISGGFDGILAAAAGTVSNAGTIEGQGNAGVLLLFAGGSIANSGSTALISGHYGIAIGGANGTVANAGTIQGTGTSGAHLPNVIGAGLYFGHGGTVITPARSRAPAATTRCISTAPTPAG